MGGEIAPFGSVLLRSESAASSQIENLNASAHAIAEAEIGDLSRRNAAQIVANVRAMEAALALANEIDEDSILAMHRALMESTEPAIAGTWRTEQVWVGGSNVGPHGAVFVAPHHKWVVPAIADLIEFIRRDDLQVLVHAALAHASRARWSLDRVHGPQTKSSLAVHRGPGCLGRLRGESRPADSAVGRQRFVSGTTISA